MTRVSFWDAISRAPPRSLDRSRPRHRHPHRRSGEVHAVPNAVGELAGSFGRTPATIDRSAPVGAVNKDRVRREIAPKASRLIARANCSSWKSGRCPGCRPGRPGEPDVLGKLRACATARHARAAGRPAQRERLGQLLNPGAPSSRPTCRRSRRRSTAPAVHAGCEVRAVRPSRHRRRVPRLLHGDVRWANRAINKLTGEPLVPAFLLTFESFDAVWALSGPWDPQGNLFKAPFENSR